MSARCGSRSRTRRLSLRRFDGSLQARRFAASSAQGTVETDGLIPRGQGDGGPVEVPAEAELAGEPGAAFPVTLRFDEQFQFILAAFAQGVEDLLLHEHMAGCAGGGAAARGQDRK